jgi:phosphohistidine phosphatase SixA
MPGPTTIILLRHAERETVGTDPSLTVAGKKRAQQLARMLRDAGVTAVFTSDARRTKETAAPLVAQTHLTPVELTGTNSATHRASVLAVSGGTAVVIGRTNTVPALITALGGGSPEILESEFDRLFVVTRSMAGDVKLLALRY